MTGAGEREQGFTLIEVTITAVILLIAMTGLLGLLDSQTRSEHTVQTMVATQQDVRLAVTAMARDIRAGDVTAASEKQVELDVYDSPGSTTATHVRWRLDTGGAAPKLVREAGGSLTLTYSLAPVADTTLFTYYSPRNNALVAGGNLLASQVAGCTERVSVSLEAPTGATATSLFTETSDVAVRNSPASASFCP